MFKRIGIIHHPSRKKAIDIVSHLHSCFKKLGVEVVYTVPLNDWREVQASDINNVNIVVSVGGDGTLIRVSHLLLKYDFDIPIWPIAAGEFNFMPDSIEVEQLSLAVERLVKGEIDVWHKSTLSAEVENLKKVFVNDIVILKDNPLDILDMDIYIDSSLVGSIKGDGATISTSSGSTGYSLSAGGPIVDSKVNAYILMMLNPHHITVRPIVLDISRRLSIRVREKNWHLLIDGLSDLMFSGNNVVKVYGSNKSVNIIHVKGFYSWAENLYSKFHWGSRYVESDNT